MKTLLRKTETYKVNDEEEALSVINQFRSDARTDIFEVSKASYRKKTKKEKGEVVDEWVVLDVTFDYEVAEEDRGE